MATDVDYETYNFLQELGHHGFCDQDLIKFGIDDIACLKRLRAQGCPWDLLMGATPAKCKTLEELRKDGFPWLALVDVKASLDALKQVKQTMQTQYAIFVSNAMKKYGNEKKKKPVLQLGLGLHSPKIDKKSMIKEAGFCAFCCEHFEDNNTKVVITSCEHVYHKLCYENPHNNKWKDKCAVCQTTGITIEEYQN